MAEEVVGKEDKYTDQEERTLLVGKEYKTLAAVPSGLACWLCLSSAGTDPPWH